MIKQVLEIKKERCKMKKLFCLGFLLIGFSGIAQSDKDKNSEQLESLEESLICIDTKHAYKNNCQSSYYDTINLRYVFV